MSADVERVARAAYEAHCAVMFPDEPVKWGRGGYATQSAEWQAIAAAAMRETRLIDAEALREQQFWDGGRFADWLTTRAGGSHDT